MSINTIFPDEFQRDVSKLVTASSALKLELFRGVVNHKDLDIEVGKKYLNTINLLAIKYDDVLKNISKAMRSYKSPKGDIYAIPYDRVRGYINRSYDYASCLKFTEELYDKISSGNIKSDKDVKDKFEDFAEDAFPGMEEDIASVMGDVDEIIGSKRSVSGNDLKIVESIIWEDVYHNSHVKELTKSLTNNVNYLYNEIPKETFEFGDDVTAPIIFVTNCVEYMTYSALVFIARSYIIGFFAREYYESGVNVPVPAYTESVDFGKMKIDVMNSADEMDYRIPNSSNKYKDLVCEFLGAIGTSINDECDGCKPNIRNSKIYNELIGNKLIQYIFSDALAYNNGTKFADVAATLYQLTNATDGKSYITNSKQEIFTYIRDLNIDNTKDAAEDIAKFSIAFLERISTILMHKSDDFMLDFDAAKGSTPEAHGYNQFKQVLSQLYSESVHVFITKFKDIEARVNIGKMDDVDKMMLDVSIKTPDMKNDNSSKDNMMTAVPDVLPVPISAMESYDKLRMYSEYAKTVLENDNYYSEAVDFSKLVDAFQAIITSFFRQVSKFFTNKSLVAAAKWVEQNKMTLTNAEYEGPMEVLPYLQDITYPSSDTFIEKMAAFSESNIVDDASLDKFIDTLYSGINPELVKIMKSDDKNKKANIQNFVLFGVRPGATVQTKTLNTSAEIKKEMLNWISNVTGCVAVGIAYANSERKANDGLKTLKSKVAAMSNSASDEHSAPTIDEGNETKPATPVNDGTRIQTAVSRVQEAYSSIIIPGYDIFHKIIMDEYGYIKNAYSKIKK